MKGRTFTTEFFQKSGAKGGRKAAANLTPAQRKERARKAALARWSREKKKAEE